MDAHNFIPKHSKKHSEKFKQFCMQCYQASLHRHHTSLHFHHASMHSHHAAAMLIMQQVLISSHLSGFSSCSISACKLTMRECILTKPVCIFIKPVCIPSMQQLCQSCSNHPKQFCMQYNHASLHHHYTSFHFHHASMHSQHGAAMLIMERPS